MNTFLQAVANDLYDKLEGDFSTTAVIFPNKRAGLFFNQWLAQRIQQPVWSPVYMTISELFRSLTPYTVGDSIKLVAILHRIFCEETLNEEPLDTFYFWGEMLISDFDDLDKHLVDADKLFSNLRDLRNLMDDHSYLTPEQVSALKLFFQNFSIERETELKETFMQLWDKLGNIYHRFKQELARQQIAYEGMLYRAAIEEGDLDSLPYERYVFVGFNVLNQVESTLFDRLQQQGKALFYWDYDEAYLNNPHHEAGEFIRRNLRRYPNQLEFSAQLYANLARPKQVQYIAASTENAQVRYLPGWLRNHLTKPHENETAIVLCNEALLQPVLHALPADVVDALNVTMGYPLSQTPVYSLVSLLLDLHCGGYDPRGGRYFYRAACAVLRHPYVRQLSRFAETTERELTERKRFFPPASELHADETLTALFPAEGAPTPIACCHRLLEALRLTASLFRTGDTENPPVNQAYRQLYQEALYRAYTTVNRFTALFEQGELEVQMTTFCRLLRNVMASLSVPFHGEPAEGLQVMGVLETRNLDFRHLVMLSLNEGQLPKAEADASFIPYNLRKAFGMTTIEHKNAVYAYYFYRLIQRAQHVTLLYNTSADGLNRGEMSRFMLQYLIEGKQQVHRFALTAEQQIAAQHELAVPGSTAISETLKKRFSGEGRVLSPTALNTYIDCPFKFYLKYVCGLREADNVSPEIENSDFGNIFHATSEIIYKEVLQPRHGLIQRQDIEALLDDDLRIGECVNRAFKQEFFKIPGEQRAEYNGLQLLNREVLKTYTRQLLHRDAERAPFAFLESEKEVKKQLPVTPIEGEPFTLNIGGIIDRIDEKEGIIRIIDYKTGHHQQKTKDLAQLFDPANANRAYHILQTILYALIYAEQKADGKPVVPGLFYVQLASDAAYSPIIAIGKEEITDINPLREEFTERLDHLLSEMFSPTTTFTQTACEEHCTYCPFKTICNREGKKEGGN